MNGGFTDRWFPLARSEEVIPRQLVHSQLLGQEIVLWRDDDGALNAWENRCPHRGVRLSIGFNTGTELRCQYHGWRFAGGSGQCTFIPAHPQQKPAATLRATTYRVTEQQGFAWASLGAPTTAPTPRPTRTPTTLDDVALPAVTLRSTFIAAPTAEVATALRDTWHATAHDPFTFATDTLVLMLQPLNDTQTLIHGILHSAPEAAERLPVLRLQHARLTALRDALEERHGPAPTRPLPAC